MQFPRDATKNGRTAMRKLAFLLAVFSSLLCCEVSADQVTMKNGDRLTGTIVKFDGDKLTIKSEFAGEVQIPWAAIEKMTSDQPVYEAELARQRQAIWNGSADAGLSATRGNSDTLVISLGTQVARATQRDKLSFYAASLLARNGTNGVSITTAEAIRGGARYDRDISKRLFGFGLTDLEHDKFQKLDLRLVLGGGLGFHARKTEKTRLDLFGGGSYNREKFSIGLTRNSAEALLGEELSYQMSETTSLSQSAVLF